MRLIDLYTVVVTPYHKACRDFHVRCFGAEVVFEASWFVLLAIGGGRSLAFMAPDHPSSPPGPETFNGTGVFITFQVEDASAELARLTEAGASLVYELRDEPWGQRRFALRDPSGMWIDVVEQTEPKAGFWEPYLA